MTVEDCLENIKKLDIALECYNLMQEFKKAKLVKKELLELQCALYNYELDNSYNPNTGVYHEIYKG